MFGKEDDYKVELDVFEGPLDLLLYLIRRDEIDIYDIPIERITTQYMEYLHVMRMLDLNIAGEFLVMAATLMMIKSRMLLPVDEQGELEDEEGEDPRWELVRQLVEYKRFKDAAGQLQEREWLQENVFDIGADRDRVELEPDSPERHLHDVSIFDLITAFNDVLKRAPEEDFSEIVADRYTVADKIDYVLRTTTRRPSVRFKELFRSMASRNEIVCTFLAILELIRLRQIAAKQDDAFGEIVLCATDEDNAEFAPVAEAAQAD